MGFLNPQDDKLESTREKFEKQKKKKTMQFYWW